MTIDIDAAERLCSEATPGPWTLDEDRNGQQNVYGADGEWIALLPHQCVVPIEQQRIKDAEWIAAARTLLPQALSELASLRAENERLRENVGIATAIGLDQANKHTEALESVDTLRAQLSDCKEALATITRERDEARIDAKQASGYILLSLRANEQVERDTAEAIAAYCDAKGFDHTADLIREGHWRPGRDGQQGGE